MRKVTVKFKETSSTPAKLDVAKLKKDQEIIEKSLHGMNTVDFMLTAQVSGATKNQDLELLTAEYRKAWESLESLVRQIKYVIARQSRK